MYGHVCETGGTREVLPPRSSKRFTFKVCLNLKIDLRSGQKSTTNKIKELRAALESVSSRRPTRRKIVLRAGASTRVRLVTYIFDSSKERYFVQEDLLSHEYSPPRLFVLQTNSLV